MINAEKYAGYLRYYSFTTWKVNVLTFEETVQFVYLAWVELGQPKDKENEINFDVLNKTREYLYKFSKHYRIEKYYNDKKDFSSSDSENDKMRFVKMILKFYETHTATETIKFFNLKDTRKIRKTLSELLPKPQRNSGKKFGEKRKKINTNETYNQLIKRGIPKATAWRASQRGYYYKKCEEKLS